MTDIDRRVAERVMGWKPCHVQNIDCPIQNGWQDNYGNGITIIPPYSTDMNCAIEVVERMGSLGYNMHVTYYASIGQYGMHFLLPAEGYAGTVFEYGFPLAICKAALMAVGDGK